MPRLVLTVTPEAHRLLKHAAIEAQRPMAEVVTDLITNHLAGPWAAQTKAAEPVRSVHTPASAAAAKAMTDNGNYGPMVGTFRPVPKTGKR